MADPTGNDASDPSRTPSKMRKEEFVDQLSTREGRKLALIELAWKLRSPKMDRVDIERVKESRQVIAAVDHLDEESGLEEAVRLRELLEAEREAQSRSYDATLGEALDRTANGPRGTGAH